MSLRDWRARNNVTLAELSEAVGVSLGHLSHLELGKKNWSVELAKRIETFTRGQVAASSLLGLASSRKRRDVSEDDVAFEAQSRLTIDVLVSTDQAQLFRKHSIDIETVARAGAEKAIREAQATAWAEANREAIEDSRRWIEKHGTLAEQLGLI